MRDISCPWKPSQSLASPYKERKHYFIFYKSKEICFSMSDLDQGSAHCVWKSSFIGTQPCPFMYILSKPALPLQRTGGPTKPKTVTVWPFTEQVCWPLSYTISLHVSIYRCTDIFIPGLRRIPNCLLSQVHSRFPEAQSAVKSVLLTMQTGASQGSRILRDKSCDAPFYTKKTACL